MKQLRKSSKSYQNFPLLIFASATIFINGCTQPYPRALDSTNIEWATYSNRQLNYSMKYPNIYSKSEEKDGKEVVFKYDGITAMRVVFVSEEEGDSRGLWVGNKAVEKIEMGGQEGYRYVYDHYDAIASVHTISCVIEYKGKFLGLEFRTANNMLDDVQKKVLNSMEFEI